VPAYFYTESRYPQPISYQFNAGLEQQFPDELYAVDFNLVPEQCMQVTQNNVFPLIIEMKTNATVTSEL